MLDLLRVAGAIDVAQQIGRDQNDDGNGDHRADYAPLQAFRVDAAAALHRGTTATSATGFRTAIDAENYCSLV
jgi:hypothetical protein